MVRREKRLLAWHYGLMGCAQSSQRSTRPSTIVRVGSRGKELEISADGRVSGPKRAGGSLRDAESRGRSC